MLGIGPLDDKARAKVVELFGGDYKVRVKRDPVSGDKKVVSRLEFSPKFSLQMSKAGTPRRIGAGIKSRDKLRELRLSELRGADVTGEELGIDDGVIDEYAAGEDAAVFDEYAASAWGKGLSINLTPGELTTLTQEKMDDSGLGYYARVPNAIDLEKINDLAVDLVSRYYQPLALMYNMNYLLERPVPDWKLVSHIYVTREAVGSALDTLMNVVEREVREKIQASIDDVFIWFVPLECMYMALKENGQSTDFATDRFVEFGWSGVCSMNILQTSDMDGVMDYAHSNLTGLQYVDIPLILITTFSKFVATYKMGLALRGSVTEFGSNSPPFVVGYLRCALALMSEIALLAASGLGAFVPIILDKGAEYFKDVPFVFNQSDCEKMVSVIYALASRYTTEGNAMRSVGVQLLVEAVIPRFNATAEDEGRLTGFIGSESELNDSAEKYVRTLCQRIVRELNVTPSALHQSLVRAAGDNNYGLQERYNGPHRSNRKQEEIEDVRSGYITKVLEVVPYWRLFMGKPEVDPPASVPLPQPNRASMNQVEAWVNEQQRNGELEEQQKTAVQKMIDLLQKERGIVELVRRSVSSDQLRASTGQQSNASTVRAEVRGQDGSMAPTEMGLGSVARRLTPSPLPQQVNAQQRGEASGGGQKTYVQKMKEREKLAGRSVSSDQQSDASTVHAAVRGQDGSMAPTEMELGSVAPSVSHRPVPQPMPGAIQYSYGSPSPQQIGIRMNFGSQSNSSVGSSVSQLPQAPSVSPGQIGRGSTSGVEANAEVLRGRRSPSPQDLQVRPVPVDEEVVDADRLRRIVNEVMDARLQGVTTLGSAPGEGEILGKLDTIERSVIAMDTAIQGKLDATYVIMDVPVGDGSTTLGNLRDYVLDQLIVNLEGEDKRMYHYPLRQRVDLAVGTLNGITDSIKADIANLKTVQVPTEQGALNANGDFKKFVMDQLTYVELDRFGNQLYYPLRQRVERELRSLNEITAPIVYPGVRENIPFRTLVTEQLLIDDGKGNLMLMKDVLGRKLDVSYAIAGVPTEQGTFNENGDFKKFVMDQLTYVERDRFGNERLFQWRKRVEEWLDRKLDVEYATIRVPSAQGDMQVDMKDFILEELFYTRNDRLVRLSSIIDSIGKITVTTDTKSGIVSRELTIKQYCDEMIEGVVASQQRVDRLDTEAEVARLEATLKSEFERWKREAGLEKMRSALNQIDESIVERTSSVDNMIIKAEGVVSAVKTRLNFDETQFKAWLELIRADVNGAHEIVKGASIELDKGKKSVERLVKEAATKAASDALVEYNNLIAQPGQQGDGSGERYALAIKTNAEVVSSLGQRVKQLETDVQTLGGKVDALEKVDRDVAGVRESVRKMGLLVSEEAVQRQKDEHTAFLDQQMEAKKSEIRTALTTIANSNARRIDELERKSGDFREEMKGLNRTIALQKERYLWNLSHTELKSPQFQARRDDIVRVCDFMGYIRNNSPYMDALEGRIANVEKARLTQGGTALTADQKNALHNIAAIQKRQGEIENRLNEIEVLIRGNHDIIMNAVGHINTTLWNMRQRATK